MSPWNKKKPLLILAPMEDVTDTVFRQVVSSVGRPDLFFTEFTNVDGLASIGKKVVAQRLLFEREEKPIIAQIWGLKPENYFKEAKRLVEMGYDGIDINMGCPQRSVISRGACAALMNNRPLAKEIIQATKEGAEGIPVSVKTRIGFKTIIIEDWVDFLLDQKIAALTLHCRTVAEMSSVPAHWDQITKAVKIRDEKEKKLNSHSRSNRESILIDSRFRGNDKRGNDIPHTLIIGNGDIKSLKDAKEKAEKYKLDGIMIGRGVFENPWIFNESFDIAQVTLKQRTDLLLKHLNLWEKTWGKEKNFQILKKYFKIYISGFPGAQDVRIKLMATNKAEEVRKILSTFE